MELWKEKYASNMKNKVKIRSMGEKIVAHKNTVCTANILLSFSLKWMFEYFYFGFIFFLL